MFYSHIFLTFIFNSSKFLNFLLPKILLIIPQTCSIGFKSGLCATHSSSSIWLSVKNFFIILEVWQGAPFCWKTYSISLVYSKKASKSFLRELCINSDLYFLLQRLIFQDHQLLWSLNHNFSSSKFFRRNCIRFLVSRAIFTYTSWRPPVPHNLKVESSEKITFFQ